MHKCFLIELEESPERRWVRPDTGEVHPAPHLFGPGAMWDAPWMTPMSPGDGHYYVVVLPDGREWSMDQRAGNCGSPDDNTHRCWVRHGDAPNLTVDKLGDTCTAGAGSIGPPKSNPGGWHGFLKNGWLYSVTEQEPQHA